MLPVEPFIPKLDPTRHKTSFLEFLEGRVYRPGLGLPVTREPFFQFSDHLIPVHRLLRQEEEQPEGDGSHFHPPRCGDCHQLTRAGANRVRAYMRRYATQSQVDQLVGQINIHRCATCVANLLKEGFE